jgi:hypothetical protein
MDGRVSLLATPRKMGEAIRIEDESAKPFARGGSRCDLEASEGKEAPVVLDILFTVTPKSLAYDEE